MFTPKSLAFLRALQRNNRREWFHANRERYEKDVRAPMTAIVERLAKDFAAFAPDLCADPKVSMFRPWRDTRFSGDKKPLKTHVAAVFPHRVLGRMNGAALYFEVAPKWVWIGGGIYAPDTSQLQLLREHLAERYQELDQIARSAAIKRLGGLQGERLLRVPRGFPKDHPAAHYLQFKQILAHREEEAEFATRPDFYKQLLQTFRQLSPLVRFLNEPLVASQSRTTPLLLQAPPRRPAVAGVLRQPEYRESQLTRGLARAGQAES